MLSNDQNVSGVRALYPEIPQMLLDLMDSNVEFYLTGSRAWRGVARRFSDWDLFAQDSPELRATLEDLGFMEEFQNNYAVNNNANIVFELVDAEIGISIHIQLVDNPLAKLDAQRVIKRNVPGLYSLDKRMRSSVWRAVQEAMAIGS